MIPGEHHHVNSGKHVPCGVRGFLGSLGLVVVSTLRLLNFLEPDFWTASQNYGQISSSRSACARAGCYKAVGKYEFTEDGLLLLFRQRSDPSELGYGSGHAVG